MRRFLGISVISIVVLVCFATEGVAAKARKPKAKSLSGIVSVVDLNAKSFTLKDSAGVETQLVWTDATKIVNGPMKDGDKVQIKWLEREGKKEASYIAIAKPKKGEQAAKPTTP